MLILTYSDQSEASILCDMVSGAPKIRDLLTIQAILIQIAPN
jgi:hypothetical protein